MKCISVAFFFCILAIDHCLDKSSPDATRALQEDLELVAELNAVAESVKKVYKRVARPLIPANWSDVPEAVGAPEPTAIPV